MMAPQPFDRFVLTDYPAFDEVYFEWIDLLQSVEAAKGQFTMIELGAGWGRWVANAAFASRLPVGLVAVEAEPTLIQYLHTHFSDNDRRGHTFIEAAISD